MIMLCIGSNRTQLTVSTRYCSAMWMVAAKSWVNGNLYRITYTPIMLGH